MQANEIQGNCFIRLIPFVTYCRDFNWRIWAGHSAASIYTRADQLQTAGGPHNFLNTLLRSTLVCTCKKGSIGLARRP